MRTRAGTAPGAIGYGRCPKYVTVAVLVGFMARLTARPTRVVPENGAVTGRGAFRVRGRRLDLPICQLRFRQECSPSLLWIAVYDVTYRL